MRPLGVVIDPPLFDGSPGVSQVGEPVFVQAFIPELSVKAFNKCILDRLTRFDEVQPDAVAISPFIQCLTDQFRPVIDDDSLGQLPYLCVARQSG